MVILEVFIADSWQVEAWFLVFAVLVFAIILGGVKKWRRTYVKDHDAGSGSSGCDCCHLFNDTARSYGRSKIFPDSEL